MQSMLSWQPQSFTVQTLRNCNKQLNLGQVVTWDRKLSRHPGRPGGDQEVKPHRDKNPPSGAAWSELTLLDRLDWLQLFPSGKWLRQVFTFKANIKQTSSELDVRWLIGLKPSQFC